MELTIQRLLEALLVFLDSMSSGYGGCNRRLHVRLAEALMEYKNRYEDDTAEPVSEGN